MFKETVWVHSSFDWTSIIYIEVGKNSMGDSRQVALHFMAAPLAGKCNQDLGWEQAFNKKLNSVKNSKGNLTTDFEKSVILKCR